MQNISAGYAAFVYRLGHSPFKARRGVRFPYAVCRTPECVEPVDINLLGSNPYACSSGGESSGLINRRSVVQLYPGVYYNWRFICHIQRNAEKVVEKLVQRNVEIAGKIVSVNYNLLAHRITVITTDFGSVHQGSIPCGPVKGF